MHRVLKDKDTSRSLCEEVLVLLLPGPWVDWPVGVGYRQDAGMGCGG